MGVVRTDQWLFQFIQEKKNSSSKRHLLGLQKELLIKRIAPYFPHFSDREIHYSLLQQGLFNPDANIDEVFLQLRKKNIWKQTQQEYLSLKKEWRGVEVNIFLLPIEERNEALNELGNKTGIAFADKIILFVPSKISELELKALLTHEYNHSCRLKNLNKRENELTLLDSLIIEGLGERAVAERLGEKALAPWTKKIDKKSLMRLWEQYYQMALSLKGKEHHHLFLYGNEMQGIPKWTGYALGYEMVSSIRTKTVTELLPLHSEEILKYSSFFKS